MRPGFRCHGMARLLAASCVAWLCLTGCSGDQEAVPPVAAEEPAVEEIRIGLIAKSANNPVFLAARTGAEARAAELAREHGMNIVIDWQTPATENADEQARRIARLAADGADAIIVSVSGAEALTPAINRAVERGVPVVTFDSDAPDSKRFAFYGVDDADVGRQVMQHLAEAMGGQGQVAILAGNENARNLQDRVRGVREEAAKHPGIEIVDVFYHTETPEDATEAVIRAMAANPATDGWAMIGGWPLFSDRLAEIWPQRWPDVKIVSVDAMPPQFTYVERGIAPVLLGQNWYDWGYVTVDLAFRRIRGEDVPQTNAQQLVPVTRASLGDWARELRDWGFYGMEPYVDMPSEGR